MSLKALRRLTFAFSAALLAASAFCSELTEFRDRVSAASTMQGFQAVLDGAPEAIVSDPNYAYYLQAPVDQLVQAYNRSRPSRRAGWQTVKSWLLEQIDAEIASQEGPTEGEVSNPGLEAKKILANPIYTDPSEKEGRNWIDQAGDRIGDRVGRWLRNLFGRSDVPNIAPGAGLLGGLRFVAWAAILVLIGLVLFFVIKNFTKISRKRRVGGILEDDEPDRTADQWIEQANRLVAEGRHREAVRCLYIACLVRYDDGRIARFRRHETNWEHLYRIEASPERPQGVDFRATTQKFDKIWYGNMVRGIEDVEEFMEVYTGLCEALKIRAAA